MFSIVIHISEYFLRLKYSIVLIFFIFTFSNFFGQKANTVVINADTTILGSKYHSPRKALFLSAIVPGLGQIYNNKVWKVPVIYGAAGASFNAYSFNQVRYKKVIDYLEAIYQKKSNGTYVSDGEVYDVYGVTYTSESGLKNARDFYRRNRDMTIFIISAVYFLNIIDAMVDAYFYEFDVSEDLSMSVRPALIDNLAMSANVGLKINFKF